MAIPTRDTTTITVTTPALENEVLGVKDGALARFEVIALKNTIEMTVSQTDITDASYRYYGGLVGTAWKINRYSVTTYVKTSATIANNSGQANLAAAWTNRLTLTYA